MNNAGDVLRLTAIRKSYNIGTPVEAEILHGINLTVAAGEFTALIGPSGSGKSTLLNTIGLLEAPTSGEVEIAGNLVSYRDDDTLTRLRSQTLGFVFQFHHLLPAFSALENVLMPQVIAGNRITEALRREALQLLESVGLRGAENKKPAELSGGMQQRVAIARALASQSRLLLLDEPLAAVDALTRADMQDLLLDLAVRYDQTCVLVTHDVEEAVYMADRVVVLTRRPTSVDHDIRVDLPKKRDQLETREDPRFLSIRHDVLSAIRRFRAQATASELS